MSLASGLWTTHYRNAGRVVARAHGEHDMLVSFVDLATPSRVLCLSIGGWIEGFVELGARTAIQVDHAVCRCDGAPRCDFRVTWSV